MKERYELHNDIPVEESLPAGCRADPGRPLWQGVLFICCVTLLAYSSVFTADFIWDDDAYVLNNMHLRSLDGLLSIWFEPGATPQYYPMVFTLFWVQFHFWGLNPFGYHLVNILLHIANALLLWLCLKRIRIPAAFWVAALFALHPVQVESVAWITELKNVLSLFFYLLSLLAYLRWSVAEGEAPPPTQRRIYYAASLLFFSLALFSKTVSGSLPAAILLIRWWQTGRICRREVVNLIPFFALAVFLGRQTARLEVTHVLAKGAEWDFSIIDRFLIAGRAAWFYAGKLLWPHPLVFNYPRWKIDAGALWQYVFPLALFSLLIVLWSMRKRLGRGALAAVLFFVGTLFPALGFFNVYPMRFSFVADHFQYIASIGVIVLFCSVTSFLQQKLTLRLNHAETIFLGTILLIFALLTWQQGKIYKDNLVLFSDTIEKNPASWFSYANRAAYYADSGRDDLVISDLEQALKLKPDEADALHHRGIIHIKNREFDAGFAALDRSIAIRPWRTDYYKGRCEAYKFAGRLEEALADADRVIAMEPGDVQNYLHRASIHAMREEHAKALADLNLAVAIDPEAYEVYANRGLMYYRLGQLAQAINDYDKALSLSPDAAETYFNRGLAHAAAGSEARSRTDLIKARDLGYSLNDSEMNKILSKHRRQQKPTHL